MTKAVWNGVTIAESDDTVVVEGNHYFPRASVDATLLVDSATTSGCPWKGTAKYHTIRAGGAVNKDAAWYYPEPKSAAAEIKDRDRILEGRTGFLRMSTTFTLDTSTSRANPTPAPMKRLTVPAIRARKSSIQGGGEPLVMLTAYTVRMAQLLDPHCDLLLVGDSLGQVIYGLPSTVPVTLDLMAAHGAAVVRGSYHSVVVIDMPFGSYEASPEQAFTSAARLLKETGAAAVKLEGGEAMAPTIAFLSTRGIPVMAHVGLTPQAVNQLGGYGARGRSDAERARIIADAIAVDTAGAFAMVIEGVVEPIAVEITQSVSCPTIGIGASAQCDGQVLVAEDMLGLFERTARFVKRYGAMADAVTAAATGYAADVRSRAFPTSDQTYAPK